MRSFCVAILLVGCGGDPPPQMMVEEPDLSDPGASADLAKAKPDMARAACVSSGCGVANCGSVVDNCGDTIQCGSCGSDSVCSSNQCVVHCGDGVKDGDESDVDCGGSCGKCAADKACVTQADCAAGTCDANVCRAGTFTALADMPTAREEAAVTLGPDGKIWVLGGYVSNNAPVTKVEVYDPAKNSWSSATSMGTARARFGAAFGNDGKLYVAGGPEASNATAGASQTAEVYDPASKMWTALPSLSVGRAGLRLAKDATGRLVAFGGYAYLSYYQTEAESPEAFTPGDSAWKPITLTLLEPRDAFGLVVLADGTFLLAGGQHWVNNAGYDPMCTGICTPKQDQDEADTIEICDLAAGCSTMASFSGDVQFGQRELAAARADDGTVYLFGDDNNPVSAWKLSGSTLTRIASGGIALPNGAAVSGGKIYVVDRSHLYLFTP